MPFSEFYSDKKSTDGLFAKCKKCVRSNTADYLNKKREDPLWVIKDNERMRKRRADGLIKPSTQSKEERCEIVRRWQGKNPHKQAAHRAVSVALNNGSLVKLPCEVCGNKNSEAHHDDYTKPLEVNWLCKAHHAERHVKLREGKLLSMVKNPHGNGIQIHESNGHSSALASTPDDSP